MPELILEGRVVRAVEARALRNPNIVESTSSRRRQLIRLAVRDGKVCFHCGQKVHFQWDGTPFNADSCATFDHVVTKKDGGSWDDENGVLSCHLCNGLRGHKSVEEFQAELSQYASPQEMLSRKKHITRIRKFRKRLDREYKIRFSQVLRQKEFRTKFSLLTRWMKPKGSDWKLTFACE